MKFLICGDLHLTPHTPENRIDDFEETSLRKLKFILDTAGKNKVHAILQPGDFTDSPTMPWNYFTKVVDLINSYSISIITVYGQHDLKYRNKGNTSLDGLASACPNIRILHSESPSIDIGGIHIIEGLSYGETATTVIGDTLLLHRMIIPSEKDKIWVGQKEYKLVKTLMNEYGTDLIISGDNHHHFRVAYGKKTLINCGSILRARIDQMDHKPVCYIHDINKPLNVFVIYIPIEPPSEVFDMEEVETVKKRNKELDSFVEGLTQHKEMGLHFEDNLKAYCTKNKIKGEVLDIIEECKGGAY